MSQDQNLRALAATLRGEIISMLTEAGSGHPGGSLSAADILTALYYSEMKVDPNKPQDPNRDYFVLSKGHAAPALYGVLAMKGFFPMEELATLRKLGSPLQGHPMSKKVPGVDVSTGSLGQGISAAVGIAYGLKMDAKSNRVYALLGDGETQEGQVWEALMFAAHYRLDNLVAIVDRNRLQIDGNTTDVLSPEPLGEKIAAFGWEVIEIDGHNMDEILAALVFARKIADKPVAIIANTVKGKGVSFMEDIAGWHGQAPSKDEAERALAELKLGGKA